MPVNRSALVAYFDRVPEIGTVFIDYEGGLSLPQGELITRGRLDSYVSQGPLPGYGEAELEPGGDVNGEGIGNFMIIGPNGERQVLYVLPPR